MKFTHRLLENTLVKAAKSFPSVLLTGPRRAGKTTLLRELFPKSSYFLLEDPDIIARIKSDPRTFLDNIKLPVILDEIQNTPELFNYIRTRIDANPEQKGQWLLTGSQEAPLMRNVSESMAGRVATFNLLPFSINESPKVSFIKGGFPEVLSKPSVADIWFRSYVQTYLERDVRSIISIKDLSAYRRFLAILASRCGQILNKTDIASPLGVSVPTVSEWINILEITSQIIVIPPFFQNFGKRLIKSPKIYFCDSGLLCHLLGIETEKMLLSSPFLGPVVEGFVASEIVKFQLNAGKRKELYYFRDQQGLEVDFVVPKGNKKLSLIEVKSSRTLKPEMALPIQRLAGNINGYSLSNAVVHLASKTNLPITSLSKNTIAIPHDKISDFLSR